MLGIDAVEDDDGADGGDGDDGDGTVVVSLN